MYVPAKATTLPILQKLATDKGLSFDAVPSKPAGDSMKLKPVRIGLWDQYGGSMPSGWTRWLFEQYEFPFEVVFPQTLDAGNLNAKFDVLVFVDGGIPDARRRRAAAVAAASARSRRPTASRRNSAAGSDASPSRRRCRSSKKFVENGGTILTIGSSTALGYHLGLPIKNALVEIVNGAERPLPREKYYVPGSILEARVDNTNPLAYGMDEHAMVFYDESPAFRLQPEAALKGVKPVAWYESATPLRSGWAWGQQYLDQAVSIIEAPVGKGHVVLFGNEVNWRGAAARHLQAAVQRHLLRQRATATGARPRADDRAAAADALRNSDEARRRRAAQRLADTAIAADDPCRLCARSTLWRVRRLCVVSSIAACR